jgi:hypothetical protein
MDWNGIELGKDDLRLGDDEEEFEDEDDDDTDDEDEEEDDEDEEEEEEGWTVAVSGPSPSFPSREPA